MMKPILIFWSDESPGNTRSAQLACSTTEHRLRGHSVCALGIHPIKKLKWVSSLGLKNLAFQKFAVISMNVQFFWPPLISGLFESSWWKLNLTKFQVVGCFMGTNRITFQSKLVLICKNLHILLLICTKMRKKRFCVRRDRTLAYCNRNRYSEVHFVKIAKYNSNMPELVIDVFSSIKSRFALQ